MSRPIDLDQWERRQTSRNRIEADRAMYRLGQRYGWDVPTPEQMGIRRLIKAFGLVANAISKPRGDSYHGNRNT